MSESHNFGSPADETPGEVTMSGGSPPDDSADTGDGASKERSAEEIRAEIERTREALGETVEALAEKTDVKARAGEELHAVRENVNQTVSEVRENMAQRAADLRRRAQQVTPDSTQAGVRQVQTAVGRRPWPFAAAAAFAAGLALGWLLGRG
jgi:ElaB/YqjD/DUF883 family membrane-anchored ribosome-binding protein